ncbi:hypothetical protein R1E67_27920, partial [Escherichia coli]|nr:hypothetical protein [Escherichia coli]
VTFFCISDTLVPTTYLVDTTLSNSSDSDQTVQAVRLLRKQFIDGKKDKRVQINVKISPSAKSALDRLTRARKTTQQAILEQLILNGRLD